MEAEPRFFPAPPAEARRLDLPGFLAWVGGPAIFRLPGRDSSRVRILSGGLHGNEPSGFRAIHALLRDPPDSPVDALLFLGNVRAALREPAFSWRFLPGEEDMNRLWGDPQGTAQREVAGRALHLLTRRPIEALVDLHNNTGFNPTYAVILRQDARHLGLGSAWTEGFVRYEGMHLGTLLEALGDRAPGVVVECGQAGDARADAIALAGARRFLEAADPCAPEPAEPGPPRIYRCVARITVPAEVTVEFTHQAERADLTIPPDIDRHNFHLLPAGSKLATCSPRGRLLVTDSHGQDATEQYLECRQGTLYTRRPIVPVMMTNNARVAKSDCLLYAAEVLPA